jgi:protein-S-isoprenylcysteine O-methyltransferase Ste14
VVAQVVAMAAVITASRRGPDWRGRPRVVTSVAGVALMAGGTLLGGSGAIALGRRSASAVPRPRASGRLVESGVYALVRHPIYGGQLIGAGGLALARASARAAAFVPVLAVLLVLKSAREEVFLAERYPEYPSYAARTRRFIPGIW